MADHSARQRACADRRRPRAQGVGAHQLLSGEEERELAGSVQRLLQLEAAAEREAASLGRELHMTEWAAAAGYADVGAFGECIKVRPRHAPCQRPAVAGLRAAGCAIGL